MLQRRASYRFWIWSWRSSESLRKTVCSQKLYSTALWKTLNLNKKTAKNVFLNSKSAFETRKNQCNAELSANAVTLKLLRQLQTRTKTPPSWRCVKTYTFKNCGTLSCVRKWTRKWKLPNRLTTPSKQSKRQPKFQMFRRWCASFWRESKPIPSFWKQSTNPKARLTSSKKLTKNWGPI